MLRPQLTHVFFLAIALQFLQPASRVVPDDPAIGRDRKLLGRKILRHGRARPLRETVERAAARVVGVPPRPAREPPIDARRKLRLPPAEKPEAEQTAHEAAEER